MTDIERIRRDLVACRDIPWSCSCVEPEQLAALVEEVERLRREAHEDMALLEFYQKGFHFYREQHRNATAHERAAVVAFIRETPEAEFDELPQRIERGEHHYEEVP